MGGRRKTSTELDKEHAKDMVRSFIRVEASEFFRRKMNDVWPQVSDAIDEATSLGAKVDLPKLMRQIFNDQLGIDA